MNTKTLAIVILAVYLIVAGLSSLVTIPFAAGELVLAILALVAGVLLLIDRFKVKMRGDLAMLLLGFWLVLQGLLSLVGLNFGGINVVMALLAIAAGVLLLLKK